MFRPNGISTLLACQNEEAVVGLSIVSFLRFADEVIIVDNGSTDASKEICRELARQHPEKVRFYDAPHLKDLYENRQYALERSRFRWVVRADADFVCYTDGEYDCRRLRETLLRRPWLSRPAVYHLSQPTLHGDFWHTARTLETVEPDQRPGCATRRRMRVVSGSPRIYHWYPGLRCGRFGRTEGVAVPLWLRRLMKVIKWPTPIWMQCNVKSESNMLYRSERTNWREHGDFQRYPTLDCYLRERIREAYGAEDVEWAASVYARTHFYPHLTRYDPHEAYPYPALVEWAMQHNPVYRVVEDESGQRMRTYLGVDRTALYDLASSSN